MSRNFNNALINPDKMMFLQLDIKAAGESSCVEISTVIELNIAISNS